MKISLSNLGGNTVSAYDVPKIDLMYIDTYMYINRCVPIVPKAAIFYGHIGEHRENEKEYWKTIVRRC